MSTDVDTGSLAADLAGNLSRVLAEHRAELTVREVGTVIEVSRGVVRIAGLPGVGLDEVVRFPHGQLGMALNLDADNVGVVLLDDRSDLRVGCEVRRTGRVLDVPVGSALLGRVVDALGRPLDGLSPPLAFERRPFEREAPAIMDRLPVIVPLQTGLKAIDALIPIGRGQRELILGDRQTGKSAIAVDAILNQRDSGVVCVYCSIAQRSSQVAKLVADLRKHDALRHTVVVVTGGADPPGAQYVTPYAATTMAEYFMDAGRDVLIVYDDLTRHARAYRELSLLLRRPPGREAFPGDVFYIHSRLLERATRLRDELGGGSLTALPIAETEAQNVAAYIPTNLISITDGQIYLSPDLFRAGTLPAIDVGKSVSRVGGKAQLAAYRAVAGDLRLSYSQFNELEAFSRFSTQLDEPTRRTLTRGRRVRAVLKQPRDRPLTVPEQIASLVAVSEGAFDALPVEAVAEAERSVREAVTRELPDLCGRLIEGREIDAEDRRRIADVARRSIEASKGPTSDADARVAAEKD